MVAVKHVFMKIFSKIFDNDKRGYVAILLAVFMPLALSLFYLYVTYSQVDSVRTQANIATRDAALEAANHYALYLNQEDEEKNFNIQKKYLTRRATLTFNSTMKSKFGVKENAIPMKLAKVCYKLNTKSVSISGQSMNLSFALAQSFSSVYARYSNFFYNGYDLNDYDPDYPSYLKYIPGKGVYKKEANGSDLVFDYYEPSTYSASSNHLEVRYGGESQSGVPRLKVTSHIVTDIKNDAYQKQDTRYSSTFYAEPAECNADIVLAIPLNKAAFTESNACDDSVVYGNRSYYEQIPIIEIQSALKKFTGRFMFYRGLRMGVIPYSGRLSVLPGLDNFDRNFASNYFQKWGTFTQPSGTLPTIPISDSYKTSGTSGGSLTYSNDLYFGVWGNSTVGSGIISKPYLLSESFTGSNAFRKHPTKFCYGGNISAYSMRCKVGSYFYPNPYPMIPLQEDLFSVYNYLSSFGSFELKYYDDSMDRQEIDYNLSNFIFLPFLWGNYLLNYSWAGGSTPSASRKKVLVIIANQSDFFAPHELTYLGFDNDACHVPMIDGERLDFANQLNSVTNGYNSQSSSIHSTYSENTKLEISPSYNGSYVDSGTYTLIMPEAQNVRIAVKARATLKVFSSDYDHKIRKPYYCSLKNYLGNIKAANCYDKEIEVSDDDTLELRVYSASKENKCVASPVLAKFEIKGIKLSVSDQAYALKADDNYVYLCKNEMQYSNSGTNYVKLKINLASCANYPRLSYYVNPSDKKAYFVTNKNYTSITTPSATSVSCYRKYNASTKYEFYGEEKSSGWFGDIDVSKHYTHNCMDVLKNRSTGKGSLDLHKTCTFRKIKLDVWGKRYYHILTSYPSSAWLKVWICHNDGGNTGCGGSYTCDGTYLGEIKLETTKSKDWTRVDGSATIDIGDDVSGKYVVFVGDTKHGYTAIRSAMIYYLGDPVSYECNKDACSSEHRCSGQKLKNIYIKMKTSGSKTFSFPSTVELNSSGNIISNNNYRVKSVTINGCEAFYVDKSWIKNKRISISIQNAKILSIDVSNNIKCSKKNIVSHFKCTENNLDKIALTMDFSQYGNGYDTKKEPFNIDDFLKYENSNLTYDGYWQYGTKWGSGTQGTLTIDNDACDYENGYITVSVSPTEKSLEYGDYVKTFDSLLSTTDVDISQLTGQTGKDFRYCSQKQMKLAGCSVNYYYIQGYQYDYPAEDTTMPWWHYKALFSFYYDSRNYKWTDDYPKELKKLLKSSNNTFSYHYDFTKEWAGSCLTGMRIRMYKAETDTVQINFYGKNGVCRCSLSGNETANCLCYPACSYERYTGSNSQNPQIRFYITGGYTNDYKRDGKLIITGDPFKTAEGRCVEGRGSFGVNIGIISSILYVQGARHSENQTNITGYRTYSFNIKDFGTNKININLQALKLHSIKYEGENPICYDRPTTPSKNARWIDFSKATNYGGSVIPGIDDSLQDTFSGTLLEKYEKNLQIAQANFDVAEANLKSIGVADCEGGGSEEPTNGTTESADGCFDCNSSGFLNPCTMVAPRDSDNSVVCPSKSHDEWLKAKIEYKDKYLAYLKENARITGMNVEVNGSWNAETDEVAENVKGSEEEGKTIENPIATITETDKYKRYQDYLSLKEYYNDRTYINCKKDIEVYNVDVANYENIENEYIPSWCTDDSMKNNFNYLKNDACKEKLAENMSNLKLQYYEDVGLNTNDFYNKERALTAAENALKIHLESGNGAYLEYYNSSTPGIPAYEGLTTESIDVEGRKIDYAMNSADSEVENWLASIHFNEEISWSGGNAVGTLSCHVYPYNSAKNKSKTKDSRFLTKVLDPGLVVSNTKPDATCYYDREKGYYYYYRNYSAMNNYNQNRCDTAEENTNNSANNTNNSTNNSDVDIRDYYVGSVICANSNNTISYLNGYVCGLGVSNGSLAYVCRFNNYKLVDSLSQANPFKPNGYLNPCLTMEIGKDGVKKEEGKTGEYICKTLCDGKTLTLHNAVISAEKELDEAETALDEEYEKIEKEVEAARKAKVEAYKKFIEKGVTLSVETYTDDGQIEKYKESCKDGEADPATKVRQANGEACPDKCREWKLKYERYKKAYDEAKAALKVAQDNYDNYKDKAGNLKSDELVYEDSYFRTNVNRGYDNRNAILLLLTKLHTGDLSLVAENFYNKNLNKISYQYLYDVDSSVKENGNISQLPNPMGLKYLTGLGSVFVPYDTHESLTAAEWLRDGPDHDISAGALLQTYDNSRLIFAEFTNPINSILSNNTFNGVTQKVIDHGVYDRTVNYTPTQMIKDYVLPAVISKVKTKFGNYGRIYFVNYRDDDSKGPNYVEKYSDSGKLKYYSADSAEELDKTLLEISKDIEDFTNAKSAKAYVEESASD